MRFIKALGGIAYFVLRSPPLETCNQRRGRLMQADAVPKKLTERRDMSKKVRVGMVSTSWWADSMYLPALTAHPQVELVAVCGRNRERADAFAARWRIPQVYTNVDTLIPQR